MSWDQGQLLQVLSDELRAVRSDLQELKRCQMAYFTLSVAASGAILGFSGKVGNVYTAAAVLLAPLAVVLPCWWIFFDKATTVTRNAGYLRLLEIACVRALGLQAVHYSGFERALGLLRKYEEDLQPQVASQLHQPSPSSRIRHQYWAISWKTFLGLAVVCLAASAAVLAFGLVHDPCWPAIGLVAGAWAVAAYLTISKYCETRGVLKDLMSGKYSYAMYAALWTAIFQQHVAPVAVVQPNPVASPSVGSSAQAVPPPAAPAAGGSGVPPASPGAAQPPPP